MRAEPFSRLCCPCRDSLARAHECRQLVNALVRAHGAVDVEAHRLHAGRGKGQGQPRARPVARNLRAKQHQLGKGHSASVGDFSGHLCSVPELTRLRGNRPARESEALLSAE